MGQGKGGAGVEPSLVAKVTEALKRAGMHQMTGELMEHQVGNDDGATVIVNGVGVTVMVLLCDDMTMGGLYD